MPHITTRDGTSIYVKVWGEGHPVVLMHGWPLSADSWDDQALALSEAGHKVIAYDRRGFGRSDQPGSGYDYDTMADDLADVMKECGADETALVGFSMGGGEVARYLSRHDGKNITHVALIASIVPYMLQTGDNPDGVPQSTFDEMTKGMKEDRAKFFTGFFKDFYGVGLINAPSAMRCWAGRGRQPCRPGSTPHSPAPRRSPRRISARSCPPFPCPH
jgi:non-heme chloroperoxidase